MQWNQKLKKKSLGKNPMPKSYVTKKIAELINKGNIENYFLLGIDDDGRVRRKAKKK